MRALPVATIFERQLSGYWGHAPGRSDVDVKVVRNSDVRPEGVPWDQVPIRSVKRDELEKAGVRAGDILLTTSGNCGRAALVREDPPQPAIASNFVRLLRCDPKRARPEYVFYWLTSPAVQAALSRFERGTTLKNLAAGRALGFLEIPLPDQKEQDRVAALLDKADGLRRKRQQTIAVINKVIRANFLDMFGDPVSNPRRWSVHRLESMLTFLTSGSRGWARYYSKHGKKFLRIQNIGCNELLLDDLAFVNPPNNAEAVRTMVRPGDVLLSITADLGRTAVVPEGFGDAHINQHLAILRTRGVEPIYLSQFLASAGGQRQFEKLNRAAVKSGLNFESIRSLQIVCPPTSEQLRFVRFWMACRDALHKHLGGLLTARRFFDSLSQRAFCGRS